MGEAKKVIYGGITFVMMSALLIILFSAFKHGKGLSNEGLSTVQNSVDNINLSKFDDYNQQLLSGTQVLSAIKLHEGSPVAIVVRTSLFTSVAANANKGYNYNAVLAGNTGTVTNTLTKAGTNTWYVCNLSTAGGVISYNYNTTNCSKSGNAEYVRPTAKFLAELIKDSSGTIVGICFTQQ